MCVNRLGVEADPASIYEIFGAFISIPLIKKEIKKKHYKQNLLITRNANDIEFAFV